jgi:GNAT superfamily N-acetyltransferase
VGSDPDLEVRAVDQALWGDFERFFDAKGGPKSCWCMVWRATPDEAKRPDGASRKQALERRVRSGTPIGLLGYLGGEPVAWCSVAPRSTFRRLGGAAYSGVHDDAVWSIVCFFVSRPSRGSGISRLLLNAAADYATTAGADVVEAYPVDPGSPSYRFMGFVPLFEQAAFEHVGRAGSRRHVLALRTRRHAT